MESADSVAYEAQQRVIQLFPDWTVERWTRLNSPASTILEVAKVWDADLIVMGSHGRSLIPRLFLGSVSLRVSSEAACSVRIVKRPSRPAAPTLVLAFDDSAGSRAALREVMHREWPRATAIHVATVADVTLLASLNYMEFASDELVPSRKGEETKIEHLVHSIECELQKKFLTVTSSLVIDAPVTGILNEAKAVNADTIFLGSHGHSKVHRMLLGSVAHGVCARAEMNVEIVRARS
jgi:nucleotide-binding universal stress UspA family protein